MDRRDLCRAALALPLASALPVSAGAASGLTRVRPGDAAWPSVALWQKLGETLKGRLIKLETLFAPCQRSAVSAACLELGKYLSNPFFLGDQASATQVSGWFNAWKNEPSAYAIQANTHDDVAAGVRFAREHKLRLVVKGTGHSYQGTSSSQDSLLIWTRSMNRVEIIDKFVPQGCAGTVSAVPAVSAGAGAVWSDLYHAVTTKAGRYVQGGGCTDVGVAGLVQSGGFGSFSKGFGLTAAGLLEAEVVCFDGQLRVANACTNPELFWALKGGGGGSWGVVTKVVLRTHDLPKYFGYVGGKIRAKSDSAFATLVTRVMDFYADQLFNPHWGEQISLGTDRSLKLSLCSQGLSNEQVMAVWKPFFEFVRAVPDHYEEVEKLHAGAWDAQPWWDIAWNPSLRPDQRAGAPAYHAWWEGDQDQVGMKIYGYDSLWLPSRLLAKEQRKTLVDTLIAASDKHSVGLHFNKGLAGAPKEVIEQARQCATNPAVLDAFALVIIASGGKPSYAGLERSVLSKARSFIEAEVETRRIDRAMALLRQLAPNGGSYVSESNYFNDNWQREFWGANYARLQSVKQLVDPEGLFFVRHGVGSEAWSEDGFTPQKA